MNYNPFIEAYASVLSQRVAIALLFEAAFFMVHRHTFIFAHVFFLKFRLLVRKSVGIVITVVAGEETFTQVVLGPFL